MTKLDLQLFAKTSSQMQQYRKSKAISKYAQEAQAPKETKEEEPKQTKKRTQGEVVTAVSMREVYQVYKIENGKEVPVMRDGQIVTRTGQQIMDKMIYNKQRGAWISKDKGRKYRIRKK